MAAVVATSVSVPPGPLVPTYSGSVEDADLLIARLLDWAAGDDRVSAVILTGSRARAQRVDEFSDLDVELIGPRPKDLAAADDWICQMGCPMVALPFDEADLITRLVVFEAGRKVDFGLWPESRIVEMVEHGLDDLYDRGYTVLLDKTGITDGLPRPSLSPRTPNPPSQAEFTRLESEFWFEATQVAVYLLRDDLWVVKFRENTMHNCLLRMLEWRAQSDPAVPRFTWHIGHHMNEWLTTSDYDSAGKVFSRFDVRDTIRGVTAAMDLFTAATASAASNLALQHRPDLAPIARSHVESMLAERNR